MLVISSRRRNLVNIQGNLICKYEMISEVKEYDDSTKAGLEHYMETWAVAISSVTII